MDYSADISRANPTCLIFLIDRSRSMLDPFGKGEDKKKSEGVAEIINNILHNLVIACNKSAGIHDYLHLGIIGYGVKVESALEGSLAGKKLVSIGELANNHLRILEVTLMQKGPTGEEVPVKKMRPIWIEPHANGGTPLDGALTLAKEWIQGFIAQYPDCFPPLVINLTDGMPSPPDPRPTAKALRELKSSDGRVLFFNVHISGTDAAPIEFPSAEDALPDKFSKFLYRMSSVLPAKFVSMGKGAGLNLNDQSRGFVFNADLAALRTFLEFGTRTQQQPPKPSL